MSDPRIEFPLLGVYSDQEVMRDLEEEEVFVNTGKNISQKYLKALLAEAERRGLIKYEEEKNQNS